MSYWSSYPVSLLNSHACLWKLYRIQSDISTETGLSLFSLELERSNKKVAVGAIPALQEHSEVLQSQSNQLIK